MCKYIFIVIQNVINFDTLSSKKTLKSIKLKEAVQNTVHANLYMKGKTNYFYQFL